MKPSLRNLISYIVTITCITSPIFLCAAPSGSEDATIGDQIIQLDPVTALAGDSSPTFGVSPSRTATKTDTPLADVPETVDIVGRDLFAMEGAHSLEDVLSNIAGISPSVGDGQRDQVYIRGFAATNDEYIDGVRDSETYFRDLSNIDQVEVIKGPAAALYGHGSAGGIINRVTRQPTDAPVGELDLTFGSWGDARADLDAGGPLGFGRLTYRLDASVEDSGGFRDEYFLDRHHVSPSFAWKPSAVTRILVQFDALSDRRLDDLGLPALVGLPGSGFPGTAPDVPLANYYGSPDGRRADFVQADVTSAAVTVDHDLSKNWRLHDVARIEHYTLDRNNVLPTGVYLSGGGAFDGDLSDVWVTRSGRHILRHQNDLFDQLESVWSVDTGGVTHQILAGLEVAHQTAGVHSAQYNESPVALIDPVLTDRPPGEAPSSLTYNAVASDTAGLYLQDQIAFTSHWKALVGARLDTFSVEQDTLTAPYADLRNLNRAFSPRAGLVWEPSTELSVYASAGRSFIPSGDGLSIAATNAALSPEETTSFEVGAKASLAGGLLSITTSVFQLERNISETNPLTEVVTNSGDQRSRGAEISATGHLSKRWSVSAAYSLLDARIVDGGYDSAHVLLNGLRPGLVPRNSATLFTAYELPCGLGFGGGAVSMDSRFTSNDDFVTIPAYTVLNGVVYYHRAHWLARLNINNMLNHRYYATAGEGTDATGQTVMPGAPLNLQGTVSWRF